MDDDTPNTQAAPVQATAIVMPRDWTAYSDGASRVTITRGTVQVIDFYREEA